MTLLRTARVLSNLGEDALLFYSMDGTEALGQPFEYDVEVLSLDEQLDLTKLLGQPMAVVLELQNLQLRQFTGLVTRFVLVGTLGRYVRYRATLRPWLWMLTRRSNCRIFQNKTVPQVVMAMFRDYGFSDFEDKLSPEYRSWEYLVQYRESDFNFVSRIMEQEGIYYYFRHAEGKHVLVLSDSYSAHNTVVGYETIPYIAEKHDHGIDDRIDSWRAVRQITSGAFTATDYDFEAPKANLGSTLRPGSDYPGGGYEIYDYPGEFEDTKQADQQVKVRLHAELAQHDIVRGAGNARGIHAGALMTLADFPRSDQNKEYLVTNTSISVRSQGYESLIDATVAPEEPNFRVSFGAIDSKRNFRVARSTPKPVVRGPQTARVVGQNGQEIWTDEYGRVKVQFRWDREGTFDENSSCWVRVAQIWAGSGWGGMHIPRIGQEVIVDFLEGNPDRPIITGRLYNADNMPPYTLPENQTQSGIKSHSTKGGGQDNFNELRFEDKKGEEELFMQAEKNMTTLVKNDRTTTILRNDTLNITGDQFIKIHGNLSMTVEGVTEKDNPDKSKPVKSSLGVTGAHRIDASDTIDIQAPNKITLTCGGSSITLTPDSITLKAGGGASIATDSKITATAAGKAKVTLDDKVEARSANGSFLRLDPNAYLEASGGGSVLVDPNVLAKSKSGSKVLIDAPSVTLEATKITGTGKAEVSFNGGGSSLKLNPATADLKGKLCNVGGTAAISIAAPMVKIN